MRCFNYILEKKTPIAEPDIQRWSEWIDKALRNGICGVGRTEVFHEKNLEEVHLISTIFLGRDFNFFNDPPLLFETVEFIRRGDKEETGDLDRASTWEEAEERHKDLVFTVGARMLEERGAGVQISSVTGRGYMKWNGKNRPKQN